MKISLSSQTPLKTHAELLAVGVPAGAPAKDSVVSKLDGALNGALAQQIKASEFVAKEGQTLSCLSCGLLPSQRVLLVGLGQDPSSTTAARLLGVKAGRAARSLRNVHVLAPSGRGEALSALADGIVAGAYRYTRYLTGERKPKRELANASVLVNKPSAPARKAIRHGIIAGEAVSLARDLVNCPPNDLYPASLAEAAREASREAGVQCRIFDRKQLTKMGAKMLLAVSQGSSREPRVIHMSYKPAGRRVGKVAFVGKGLTFDSGGLCLKPADAMIDMKCDMAGSAVTIATVIAAARQKLPVEVHGVVGSVENMGGPDAYRPGDVLDSLDGKTVEVINTDAEGRLVLGDVLAYARKLKPDYMIDHATLTGACMVALGRYTAGLFCGDDKLANSYLKAAQKTGESMWQLPLLPELKESLRSSIADLKHCGPRFGGAITAALFLREFVGDTPWIHVDVAGPAFLAAAHGTMPKGGTGFGVLTSLQFLASLHDG